MRTFQITIHIPTDSWVKTVEDVKDALEDTNLWTATDCNSDIEVVEVPSV